MSFRCQITGKMSRRGDPRTGEWYHVSDVEKSELNASEKLNKIVVQTRERTYYKWVKNEETNKWEEVVAGTGEEIVKELNCTDEGKMIWESWSQEEKNLFLVNLNSPKQS